MPLTASTPAPQRYLRLGNKTLMASASALVASALVAYPYAQRFGLGTQIAAHLAIPVSAGFFKLGYVVRLAASEAIDRMKT